MCPGRGSVFCLASFTCHKSPRHSAHLRTIKKVWPFQHDIVYLTLLSQWKHNLEGANHVISVYNIVYI